MNNQSPTATLRQMTQEKYNNARVNLLIMIIATVINVVLLFTSADTMFLFSATIPYYAAIVGMAFETRAALTIGLGICAIIILIYFLCWILSKKAYGWLVGALVLFAVDTAALAYLYISAEDASGIIDVVFHAWVLYYLIVGVANGKKLENLPEDEPCEVAVSAEEAAPLPEYSTPLRAAENVKARILVQYDMNGTPVIYRRVKRTNELIIGSHVYADIEMLVEPAHQLSARYAGHTVTAGCDESSHAFISIDGERVAKKLRLF